MITKTILRKIIREEVKRVMQDNTLAYAKTAIRDIFIQMPTRRIPLENWHGYKDFIIGNYGKENYRRAMAQLMRDGWLAKSDGFYQWRKLFGPVNQNNEDTAPGWSSMEANHTERDKSLKNWSKKAPTDEKSFDTYRNQWA